MYDRIKNVKKSVTMIMMSISLLITDYIIRIEFQEMVSTKIIECD